MGKRQYLFHTSDEKNHLDYSYKNYSNKSKICMNLLIIQGAQV